MRFSLILTVFYLFINTLALAQRPDGGGQGQGQGQGEPIGELKGVVADKQSKAELPYANVVVYRQRDSSIVAGTITNEKGAFSFTKLPYGKLYLMIQFVGYPVFTVDSVMIKPAAPAVNLGTIYITSSTVALDEFVVTAQKAALEFNLDRKVINIDASIAAESSTAAEIMQTIPSVSIDIDGNVSLRGSGNVIILVDGRPSMYTSLDQLPASMIESIELITNPSARYDPDGTSGMINIVLKKKRQPGYNGMVSLNAGTGNKYNGSLNFNYRQNKVNIFADMSGRMFAMKGYSNLDRATTLGDTILMLEQKQTFKNNGRFGTIRTGFDYFMNNRNTLSASAALNLRQFNNTQDNGYKNSIETAGINQLYNYFTQGTNNKNGGNGYEFGLNYKKTFEKKIQELVVDLFWSSSDWNTLSNLRRDYFNTNLEPTGADPFLQNINNLTGRQNATAQLDYVQPVGNGGRLETGYKFAWNMNQLDYYMFSFDYPSQGWINDTLATNKFSYDEQIHSAYLIYSNTIKEKFKYQFGVRAEQAGRHGMQHTTNEEFHMDTLNFFPSAHLKYDLSQNHSFQLSYSRRINRPNARVLNPFINYSDPVNLTSGNPYLIPEFINSYELGYSLFANKTVITPTIFYRNTEGLVSRVMNVENNGITSITTFMNINNEEAYGVELIVSRDLLKWWKMNANYSHYRTQLFGDMVDTRTNDNTSWTFKLNSTMKLPKTLEIQATFNYNSPQIFTGGMSNYRFFYSSGGIGIQSANYFFDVSLKKNVLKDKGSITLRVSDVFKTIKFDMESYGDNFVSTIERRRDSRVAFIGFSYRINEYKRPKPSKRTEGGMDDME